MMDEKSRERLDWLIIQYGQLFAKQDRERMELAREEIAKFVDARISALESQLKAARDDAKRLDWLLSFAIVEDVGDEQCVPGVRFRIEDMEAELCGPSLEWTPRQFIDAAMSRLAADDAVPPAKTGEEE